VALGKAEIRDLVEKEGQAQVTCEFCNEQYVLDRGELEGLTSSS
jgi:molecular chaperone Hsp33